MGIALNRPLSEYEILLKEGNQRYGNGKPGGRVEILHYIFEQLSEPVETIPALVTQAAQAFDDHVQQRIRDAGLVAGAREMLEALFARHIKLYLDVLGFID